MGGPAIAECRVTSDAGGVDFGTSPARGLGTLGHRHAWGFKKRLARELADPERRYCVPDHSVAMVTQLHRDPCTVAQEINASIFDSYRFSFDPACVDPVSFRWASTAVSKLAGSSAMMNFSAGGRGATFVRTSPTSIGPASCSTAT